MFLGVPWGDVLGQGWGRQEGVEKGTLGPGGGRNGSRGSCHILLGPICWHKTASSYASKSAGVRSSSTLVAFGTWGQKSPYLRETFSSLIAGYSGSHFSAIAICNSLLG